MVILRIDGPCAVCGKPFCLFARDIAAGDAYLLTHIRAIRRGADAICRDCQTNMQWERGTGAEEKLRLYLATTKPEHIFHNYERPLVKQGG